MNNVEESYSFYRQVYNPIQGKLNKVEDYYWNIIDTPYCQRLRNISSSGCGKFVFSSANHSYFNMSMNLLFSTENVLKDIKIPLEEEKLLKISSLVTNLGQMPFSKAFKSFISESIIPDFNYESISLNMFDDLLNHHDLKLSESDVETITNIIKGDIKALPDNKKYLCSLFNNKTYVFDIRKVNDIEVDSKYYGNQDSYDYHIPLSDARIIKGDLAFNEKAIPQLYDFFRSYYKMERNLYNHRVIVGIDLMMQDIYRLTNSTVDYRDLINTPSRLLNFDDFFLNRLINPLSNKDELNNIEAKTLLNRIYSRKLYRFLGEIFVTETLNINKISVSEFLKYTKHSSFQSHDKTKNLTEEDIVIKKICLSYGDENNDPLEKAKFYVNKQNDIVKLNKENYLMDIPMKFKEEIFRFYVKDYNKYELALETFKKYCKEVGMTQNIHQYDKGCSTSKVRFSSSIGNNMNISNYNGNSHSGFLSQKGLDFSGLDNYSYINNRKNNIIVTSFGNKVNMSNTITSISNNKEISDNSVMNTNLESIVNMENKNNTIDLRSNLANINENEESNDISGSNDLKLKEDKE